jgi:hypothetical protein
MQIFFIGFLRSEMREHHEQQFSYLIARQFDLAGNEDDLNS